MEHRKDEYFHFVKNPLMELEVDVLDVDVPLLLGLLPLDKHGIYINSVTEGMICSNPKLEQPISIKGGQLFYELN